MTVNDPTYFEANTQYFFVVTASASGRAGRFSLQIYGSVGTGTTVGGPLWYPASTNSGACLNLTTSGTQNVATVVWQHTGASGYYDVQALFATETADAANNHVFMSLATGNFTATQIAATPCSGTDVITAENGDTITPIYYRYLYNNYIYTLSVSNSQPGYFGAQVLPSRGVTAASTTYPQPQRTLPCAANASATTAGYYLSSFTAKYQQAFIDTASFPSYVAIQSFPNWAFVYSGPNVGPVSCPTSSPLIQVNQTELDTGSIVFSTTPGKEYDIIYSAASGQAVPTGAGLQIFTFEGEWVGNPAAYVPDTSSSTTTGSATPAPSTSTSTTGAAVNSTTSTTGGSPTSAPTNGNPTSTPSPTTTDTGSASSIAVSAFLLVTVAALL